MEILSAQGVVCEKEEGGTHIHLHAVLCDKEGDVIGGHIVPGDNPALATIDLIITEIKDVRLMARYDPETDSWEDLTDVQDGTNLDRPSEFSLSAYPNPFNASTTIRYHLPGRSSVSISIFNLVGQTVRVFQEEFQPAGEQDVKWHGKDEQGYALPSGIYVCRIQAGEYMQSLKLTLLR